MARGKKKAAVDAGPVEGPWDLPDGWRWERLGNCFPLQYGKALSAKIRAVGTVPVYGSSGIVGTHNAALTFGPTVVVGRKGSAGAVHFSPIGCWPIDTAYFVTPAQGMDLRYAYHLLTHLKLGGLDQSTAIPSLGRDIYSDVVAPIAPTEIQTEIAARIDALFAEIDAGEAALEDARSGVDTYRKSLLKAAVTGELTADWRRDNPPKETGEQLLARILADRRARWHADPKNARKKYLEPAGPDVDGLAALPNGWTWANLDQLATHEVRNGLSVKDTSDLTEVRALRLSALGNDIVDWSIFRFLPLTAQAVAAYRLQEGDLLVSRANGSPDLVGKASLCIEPPKDMIFPDTAIRFRLTGQQEVRQWVVRVWNSLLTRSQISKLAKTTAGILKISQGDISRIALPMPSDTEMAEINRIICSRFAEMGFEDQIEPLQDRSASLRQSILAAAFRGELTP